MLQFMLDIPPGITLADICDGSWRDILEFSSHGT